MSTSPRHPVVLNFDDSAMASNQTWTNIPLQSEQETIRFGCKWQAFEALGQKLSNELPSTEAMGCVLLGSGDYHHISYLLLSRLNKEQPIHLIICDNHPDNMRYPFGIHCGSWVYWASQLPNVARIDVLGIGSSDIGLAHAWENHWSPLRQGKLHYWSIQQDASWLHKVGAKSAWHAFDEPDSLMKTFLVEMEKVDLPVYLSIDKDVLSKDVVQTNWDQGYFAEEHLNSLIDACDQKLMGADITGDISLYQYKQWFKRLLSSLDDQEVPSEHQLTTWQEEQQALNVRLIERMQDKWK